MQREDIGATHEILVEMEQMGYKTLRLNTESREFNLDETYSKINSFHEDQYGKYESADIPEVSESNESPKENEVTELRTTNGAATEIPDRTEASNDVQDISRLDEETKKDLMSGCDQVEDAMYFFISCD